MADEVPAGSRHEASCGFARCKKGDLDGAVADLRKALEVAPPNWPHRKAVEQWIEDALKKSGKEK